MHYGRGERRPLHNEPMMAIEAVLLNGGAGTRMGGQKGRLRVGGEPMEERIARLLEDGGYPVTAVGHRVAAATACLTDERPLEGPLVALAHFRPRREYVFLCGCDLPAFEIEIVRVLAERIGDAEAAIPAVGDRLQPLAALYRAESLTAIGPLVASGERRLMAWVARLDAVTVPECEFPRPACLRSANTPAELAAILAEAGLGVGEPAPDDGLQ